MIILPNALATLVPSGNSVSSPTKSAKKSKKPRRIINVVLPSEQNKCTTPSGRRPPPVTSRSAPVSMRSGCCTSSPNKFTFTKNVYSACTMSNMFPNGLMTTPKRNPTGRGRTRHSSLKKQYEKVDFIFAGPKFSDAPCADILPIYRKPAEKLSPISLAQSPVARNPSASSKMSSVELAESPIVPNRSAEELLSINLAKLIVTPTYSAKKSPVKLTEGSLMQSLLGIAPISCYADSDTSSVYSQDSAISTRMTPLQLIAAVAGGQ